MQFLWIVPSGALAAQVVHGGYAVQDGPVFGLRLALESVACAVGANAIAAMAIANRVAQSNVLAVIVIGVSPDQFLMQIWTCWLRSHLSNERELTPAPLFGSPGITRRLLPAGVVLDRG